MSVETRCAHSRAERAASELERRGVDALLVEGLVDVRYLSGFTGSHGLVLLFAPHAAQRLGAHRFMTDFRYRAQSAHEVPEEFERDIVSGEMLEEVVRVLAQAPSGTLGLDESSISVKRHGALVEQLPQGWQAVACNGVVERLREVKQSDEIEALRASAALADEALRGLLDEGVVGRSEREVAVELELRMRKLGAEAPSFATIVAAGAHGALPHAQPREETIPRDVLVTIDWGALHDGYCSDCTRTFATGEGVSQIAREVYELVLNAQHSALDALTAGRSGREIDAVARAVIERAGQGEHFGHGLGHGVGMDVHEGPRLSRTAPETPLAPGNVVTVEPGVYLTGRLGVRIEDLAVVREGAPDVLTSLPKQLTVIA